MNSETEVPRGSMLICPELASPHWTTRFTGKETLSRYEAEIYTALILDKTLLAPARLPDLLKQEYPYGRPYGQHIDQLIELLRQLENLGVLSYFSSEQDVALANEMARIDIDGATRAGLTAMPTDKELCAVLPGSNKTAVLVSGHSGLVENIVAVQNFVLVMYQRHGCEFVEPVTVTHSSIQDLLALKNLLSQSELTVPHGESVSAEEVLRLYIPYVEFIDSGSYKVDFSVVEYIIDSQRRHPDALKHAREGITKMKEMASCKSAEVEETPYLSIAEVLKNDMARDFKKSLVRDIALTLLTMPVQIPGIAALLSMIGTAGTKVYDYVELKKSQEQLDFYFYIQSLAGLTVSTKQEG